MSFVFTVPFHLYSWPPPQLYVKILQYPRLFIEISGEGSGQTHFSPLFQMVLVNCKNVGDLRHAGVILLTDKTCCPPRLMAIAQSGNSCMTFEKYVDRLENGPSQHGYWSIFPGISRPMGRTWSLKQDSVANWKAFCFYRKLGVKVG